MSSQQITSIAALCLFLICGVIGCRGTGRSPFAFKAGQPAVQAPIQAAALGPPVLAPTVQSADDAVSQQIAAESKSLSERFTVDADPELANYASPSDDKNDYSTERAVDTASRSGSFGSSSSSASSGCSSGCCH